MDSASPLLCALQTVEKDRGKLFARYASCTGMSPSPKDQKPTDAPNPRRRSATTHERGLLDLSRRNLTSIKGEMAVGTEVDAEVVRALEQAILDLETAYGDDPAR